MKTRSNMLGKWSRLALLLLFAGSTVGLAACGMLPAGLGSATPAGTPLPPGTVAVDIIALNHPPLRPVLAEVDQTLASYGDKVHVTHYDFDTPQGADFAKRKGLTGHVPLAIFINGQDTFTVGGRKLNFVNFPQGEGTGMVADGQWTIADLDTVLKQVTGR